MNVLYALKLTELWNTSLLFDLNYKYINGASRLALVKSIHYLTTAFLFNVEELHYIHTEKYSPKSHVVNFRTQISSSQSEEGTMVFTREKNDTSNQNRERCFFTCEKNDTSTEATEVCEFRAKIPALQRRFAHIQREKFYSKSFSR